MSVLLVSQVEKRQVIARVICLASVGQAFLPVLLFLGNPLNQGQTRMSVLLVSQAEKRQVIARVTCLAIL
jgi:hypothetical protein